MLAQFISDAGGLPTNQLLKCQQSLTTLNRKCLYQPCLDNCSGQVTGDYWYSTSLSVPIEYSDGTVVSSEYVGAIDPGYGSGKMMTVSESHLIAEIIAQDEGSHVIAIRAKNQNDEWSENTSTVLTVMPNADSSVQ